MPPKHIVVIGASSGGIEALKVLVAALPGGFQAPVCVVIHTARDSPGMLVPILKRAGPLAVHAASTGLRLEDGHIYVAPPDRHLVIEPGALRVTRGPTENRFRPSIDPLFRSAAQVFGPAAIGVILTGSLDDGSAGLWAIKRLGGTAIVQDPADALFPSMPRSALNNVAVDYTLPLDAIAPKLAQLVARPIEERPVAVPRALEVEMRIARELNAIDAGLEQVAEPSPYSCPECHGVLLRLKEDQPLRFRCHTGHAYSVESLIAAVNEGIETALWRAMRALDEGALLLQHVGDVAPETSGTPSLNDQATEAHRMAETIRRLAVERGQLTPVNA